MSDKPSFWQRTKAAVKGFASNAVSYIPRGIAFTGALFAGSAILEGANIPMLGIAGITSGTQLVNLAVGSVALGSAFSGVVGGAAAAVSAGKNTEQVAANKEEQGMGEKILKEVASADLAQDAIKSVFQGPGLSQAAKTVSRHTGLG